MKKQKFYQTIRTHDICSYVLFSVSIVILWSIITEFGNRQFGGYDFSVLVDTPYRFVRNQQPYSDFYLTTPPIFAAGGWIAYKIFGITWIALVRFTAIFSILLFSILTLRESA